VLLQAATAFAPLARAEAPPPSPTEAARAEAHERFDRGLRLFNAGDNAGALVEFLRAYEIVPNPVVLYNVGLVYAQMGRAVAATDTLDQLLSSPAALSPEQLALARKTRDEQAARIAEVAVSANVAEARVEVDGIEAGRTPLSAPLRVTGGTHVVGLVAPGYSPQRKEVVIAGGDKRAIAFELVAMQGRLAHLAVKTHLPGADVFADDQRVGTTPLAASVPLSPGVHRIDLRRAGYASAHAEVTLGDGATGEIELEPQEDSTARAAGGDLVVDATETQPVVTIDGRSRGVAPGPLRLAAGPHHILVERADFEPLDRDVTIESGRITVFHAALEPTPDYRIRFAARASAQRTWGWVAVVAGAVLAGAGAGLVVYDAKQRNDGNATIGGILAESTRHSGEPCDPAGDTQSTAYQTTCAIPYANATSQVNGADNRDYAGWSAVGVGAAGLVAGIVLLVTSDNPRKYDRPSAPASAQVPPVWPTFSWSAAGWQLGIVGSF
jgi:hypothetical protein